MFPPQKSKKKKKREKNPYLTQTAIGRKRMRGLRNEKAAKEWRIKKGVD